MSPQKTLLACITGQRVSLEAPKSGADLEGGLARASRYYSPYQGIDVLEVDRDGLQGVGGRLGISGPSFKIKVDGKPTELKVELYKLINYHLIIVKVEGQKIMLHGIQEGREPRNRNGLDFEKIRDHVANGGCYDWKISGTISRPRPKLPHSSSSDRKRRGK
ncbi:uncharacterized protein [Coffea arabica]|uniref:Uncharacterized protein n=1 Tax=Coffea arabica TaxID=13443 RepID=A0A6P6SQ31_COFAR|nr:uncharacterized protein LOC113693604 [Coffea arabica]